MIKAMNRPAIIMAGHDELDREFREARAMHHKLLNIEDEHQLRLDAVSEECAPGLLRIGRILRKLHRAHRWAERASEGAWRPRQRPQLVEKLKERVAELRDQRNADPRWKEALKWLDTPDEEAPSRGRARRKATETDEEYAARCESRTAKGRDVANRREVRHKALYEQRTVHYTTWNFLIASINQARSAVLSQRKKGLSAKWKHPRWDDPGTIMADAKNFRVVEKQALWWIIEMRLFDSVVRFRTKFGNWHDLPVGATLKTCQLTRKKSGFRWKYSVSITVDGMPDHQEEFASRGMVSLDWGHREHGHSGDAQGLRVFTWLGDDGRSGEILLPRLCRELLDKIDETKSRVDQIYNARKQGEISRYGYRKRLMQSGVRTEEETNWLLWEEKYERRIESMRRKVANVRKETYLLAVRALRKQYKFFAVENESNSSLKAKAKEEMMERRKRQNRDLSARYMFVEMIERYGGEKIAVSARNTTRECPDCGHLSKNGPEILIACEGCGKIRDKDFGASRVILRRAQEVLANAAE